MTRFLSVGLLLILPFILLGCSGLEQSEYEKLRQQNAKGEFIYRSSNEVLYPLHPAAPAKPEKYPWEEAYAGAHPKITKEFFRCKGDSRNPPHVVIKNGVKDESSYQGDCGGVAQHSLPVRNKKEFIYPILLDLLNYVQAKTGRKVIITCGHRCPVHSLYADATNKVSKHLIGAEVDFYVQGKEHTPEEIATLVMQFYKETPRYRGKKEFEQFERYDKGDMQVSTMPWFNKEVFIKLCKKNEGRDVDNNHPHAYLSLQVRHDRDLNEKVVCSWEKANKGYMRY